MRKELPLEMRVFGWEALCALPHPDRVLRENVTNRSFSQQLTFVVTRSDL